MNHQSSLKILFLECHLPRAGSIQRQHLCRYPDCRLPQKYQTGNGGGQGQASSDCCRNAGRCNTGIVPQYYVEDDHPPIIPKEIFMQVQEELVRRRVVHKSPTGKKRTYSCNHCFAQMIFCGECGELYRRVHWNNHGCKSIV
jgi:hypothetical protein